jgi:hypothetical protein
MRACGELLPFDFAADLFGAEMSRPCAAFLMAIVAIRDREGQSFNFFGERGEGYFFPALLDFNPLPLHPLLPWMGKRQPS